MTAYRIYGLALDLDDRGLPEPVKRGLVKGWYERDEVEIIRACLQPGDRVLELGAGLGVTAMVAAGIVGADAVKAFEAGPSPMAFPARTVNVYVVPFSSPLIEQPGPLTRQYAPPGCATA